METFQPNHDTFPSYFSSRCNLFDPPTTQGMHGFWLLASFGVADGKDSQCMSIHINRVT